jgi:hypothetical protein
MVVTSRSVFLLSRMCVARGARIEATAASGIDASIAVLKFRTHRRESVLKWHGF